MKMLVLTYSGADPDRVSALLDAAGVPGHTCLGGARGHGLTGPRAGTRAWPGDVTVCYWRKSPSHVAARRNCPLASGCIWPFCLSTRSSNIGDLDVQ